jgi:hypothetical protein
MVPGQFTRLKGCDKCLAIVRFGSAVERQQVCRSLSLWHVSDHQRLHTVVSTILTAIRVPKITG